MTIGLQQILDRLHQEGPDLTDGQLLARFVTTRDELAFAALVRRHGPMVLGVCRRILRDAHDAEDAFQAAFLILARKATSVVKRDSLGCWLYQVAYRVALRAGGARARRLAMERQVDAMPQPETAPVEPQDWRPLLDREISRLPEKYRTVVVLCDLEGQPRREAARLLGIPEGTLASRRDAAHKRLARQLSRKGIPIATGVLTAGLAEVAAAGPVAAALVTSTTTAAVLTAANQLTAASVPAVELMRGVLRAMLMNKLKLSAGVMVVLLAIGTIGIAYSTRDAIAQVPVPAAGPATSAKPVSELAALRKENELLKLNLQVVLEKVKAQEAELSSLRPPRGGAGGGAYYPTGPATGMSGTGPSAGTGGMGPVPAPPVTPKSGVPGSGAAPAPEAVKRDVFEEIQAAVNELRGSTDEAARRRAADALEKAAEVLRRKYK